MLLTTTSYRLEAKPRTALAAEVCQSHSNKLARDGHDSPNYLPALRELRSALNDPGRLDGGLPDGATPDPKANRQCSQGASNPVLP